MSTETKIKQKLIGTLIIILGIITHALGDGVCLVLYMLGIWVLLSKQDLLYPQDDE